MRWDGVYTSIQESKIVRLIVEKLDRLISCIINQNGIFREIQIAGTYGEVSDKLVIRNGTLSIKVYLYEEEERKKYGGTYIYKPVNERVLAKTVLEFRPEPEILESILRDLHKFRKESESGSSEDPIKTDISQTEKALSMLAGSLFVAKLIRTVEIARTENEKLILTRNGLNEVSLVCPERLITRFDFLEVIRRYQLSAKEILRIYEKIKA